jgi:hypothetical protein
MNCTRCNTQLIEGENINKGWHVPICVLCRGKLLDNKEYDLTEGEQKIQIQRFKIEKGKI